MYNIDKNKMGNFIKMLRNEKGLTQKELAKDIFVSDKAISKWETGQSIPDVQILIPLSEKLGVTVTELLNGERIAEKSEKEERAVKKIINMVDENSKKKTTKYRYLFVLSTVISLSEMFLISEFETMERGNFGFVSLTISFIYGIYFCFFAKEVLPSYYDENHVDYYTDKFVRIHMVGISFNNSNWMHILNYLRLWCIVTMIVSPAIFFVKNYSLIFILPFFMTLFLPVYYIRNKY